MMSPLVDFLTLAIASCFFLTYPLVRWTRAWGWRWTGAGWIGTAAGVLTCRILPMVPVRCALVLAGAWMVSVAISDRAEALMGRKDDQRIVIDEWAGYLTCIAFMPRTLPTLLAAFVLFRIVDVWKPLGIRRLGKVPGGWGVVIDDVAAGLLVNIILRCMPI